MSSFDNADAMELEGDVAARARDRALVVRLQQTLPGHILVVSDLHLGRGLRSDGRVAGAENFFSDQAFSRMLAWGARQDEAGGPGLLVLLGDSLDFVRHDEIPDDDSLDSDDLVFWQRKLQAIGIAATCESLSDSISPVERDYGLRTDPIKTVYKIADVARGHVTLFDGLAAWLRAGGRILVIRGNHDLEWHWLAARRALRQEVALRLDLTWRAPLVAEGILFADDLDVSLGNVHLEHGNQFDPMTEVGASPVLPRSPYELALPLGSFVNRYLINQVERMDPFLDNVRPVNNAVLAVMKRHPIRSLGILIRGWRLMLRALRMRRYARALMVVGWMLLVALPVLTVLIVVAYIACAAVAAFINKVLPRGQLPLGLSGVAGPYLFGALMEVWNAVHPGQPFYAKAYLARRQGIEALPGPVRYMVTGHTHERDSRYVVRRGRETVLYLNTGTWTPLWSSRRPDLTGRVLHPLVRFTRGVTGYSHEYWEWDDARDGVVPPLLLEDS